MKRSRNTGQNHAASDTGSFKLATYNKQAANASHGNRASRLGKIGIRTALPLLVASARALVAESLRALRGCLAPVQPNDCLITPAETCFIQRLPEAQDQGIVLPLNGFVPLYGLSFFKSGQLRFL